MLCVAGFVHYCSFDSKTLCGWTQDPQNSPVGQWTLNNKETETENTGPTLDHTTEDHNGKPLPHLLLQSQQLLTFTASTLVTTGNYAFKSYG